MDYTFTVTGMTCGHCEKSVVDAIRQIDPGAQTTADRTRNRVDVTHAKSGPKALAAAIREQGYEVADVPAA